MAKKGRLGSHSTPSCSKLMRELRNSLKTHRNVILKMWTKGFLQDETAEIGGHSYCRDCRRPS